MLVARQSLHGSCRTWFQTPCCCRPKLKSDLIRSIKSDTVVARCLAFTNFLYVPSRGSCFQPPKWLIGNLILNLWEESLFKKKEERKKCNQTRRTKEWIIPSQRRHVLQTPRVHHAVYTRELSREEFSNFFSWKNHPIIVHSWIRFFFVVRLVRYKGSAY